MSLIRRIAALATSFNRRESTLMSLASLFAQSGIAHIELTVFLVDDGSEDGTANAVKMQFPLVHVIHGNGSLYWNGGMRLAFGAAMRDDFDAYLWFNDDSNLYADALARLLRCADEQMAVCNLAIVTGSMRSPTTGKRSYGGWKKRTSGFHLHFEPVTPDPLMTISCETINGNFALISRSVAKILGNLEPTFTHQIGDFDYGLRAKRLGASVLVAPGYHGECIENRQEHTWRDKELSLRQRWHHLMSPKGAPIEEWFLYTHRHFGWRWPLYALSPYIKVLLGR